MNVRTTMSLVVVADPTTNLNCPPSLTTVSMAGSEEWISISFVPLDALLAPGLVLRDPFLVVFARPDRARPARRTAWLHHKYD